MNGGMSGGGSRLGRCEGNWFEIWYESWRNGEYTHSNSRMELLGLGFVSDGGL